MDALAFALIVLCGLLVGILAGLFGIGGGWMIIPLLHVIFALPVVPTAATSLFTMVPTSVSGAIRHLRQKTAHLRVGIVLGASGALTSVLGALIAEYLPDALIILLTVAVIAFSAVRMLWSSRRTAQPQAASEALPEVLPEARQPRTSRVAAPHPAASHLAAPHPKSPHPAAPHPKSPHPKRPLPALIPSFLIGLIAGFVAGIVGVGGGFIIVPFCVAYLGFSMREAAGTSLVAIIFIALPGIVSHALLGHVFWLYGIALAAGTMPGAQLGAYLTNKIPDGVLRLAFVCLLVLAGGMLVYQQFLV